LFHLFPLFYVFSVFISLY